MTVLDHQLPGRIEAEMPNVQIGRWIVTVIASLFYVLGFIAARAARLTVFVVAFVVAAVRLGWQEGYAKPTPRVN